MQLEPGIVTSIDPPFVQVKYLYMNRVLNRRCRPVLCGFQTGLHWMPAIGDRVWIAYVSGALPIALCGLALFDETGGSVLLPKMEMLQGGETAIVSPTGSVLKWVQSGAVEMTLLDANGAMGTQCFVVNGGTRKVVADGDIIVGTISAPSGGGDCSFTLHVQATNQDMLVR